MVILSAKQIHEWDNFTIQNEPVASVDLMEAAAIRCFQWFQQNNYTNSTFHIFCGKGNNGGDGLAIGRMLSAQGNEVSVHILELGQKGTNDFQTNLARLHETRAAIHYIQSKEHFPVIAARAVVIDALFGTGLNRKVEGLPAALIAYMNALSNSIIAIDIPSGMMADDTSKQIPVVRAGHTLSLQCLKMAFMMAENEGLTGRVHVLDIGLLRNFLSRITYEAILVEADFIRNLYRPRPRFSHKGTYGHAALIAGSYGFMGAAVLAAHSCLRSGVGKLTCHIPSCGYEIVQATLPEAMVKVEKGTHYIEVISGLEKYNVVGIGPGIGVHDSHTQLLETVLSYKKPMVIDADALNILAKHPVLISKLPAFSVLTPHPAEFDRLFGKCDNDFARMRTAQQKAKELQVIIVLKGHRTFIAMPGGNNYFNSTGNPGMAKGGSGDVLTGILTGLIAQGYQPEQAALLGVYLHGLAGDIAALKLAEETMLPSDIIQYLGNAFKQLTGS